MHPLIKKRINKTGTGIPISHNKIHPSFPFSFWIVLRSSFFLRANFFGEILSAGFFAIDTVVFFTLTPFSVSTKKISNQIAMFKLILNAIYLI